MVFGLHCFRTRHVKGLLFRWPLPPLRSNAPWQTQAFALHNKRIKNRVKPSDVLFVSLRISSYLFDSLRFSSILFVSLRISSYLFDSLRFSSILFVSLRISSYSYNMNWLFTDNRVELQKMSQAWLELRQTWPGCFRTLASQIFTEVVCFFVILCTDVWRIAVFWALDPLRSGCIDIAFNSNLDDLAGMILSQQPHCDLIFNKLE